MRQSANAVARPEVSLADAAEFTAADMFSFDVFLQVLDAVSVAAVPALIIGADAEVFHANTALIALAGAELADIRAQSFLQLVPQSAADIAAAMRDAAVQLLVLPLTDLESGSAAAQHFFVLCLAPDATPELCARLPSACELVSGSTPLLSTHDVRIGLYQHVEAETSGENGRKAAAMRSSVALQLGVQEVTQRRSEGRAPAQPLPPLLDVEAWVRHFRRLLTVPAP